jgi:hypothetical protein
MNSHMTTRSVVYHANDSVIDDDADHHRADDTGPGQRNGLAKSLSPMLKMMRIWGLYFGCHGRFCFSQQSYATCQDGEEYLKVRRNIYPKIALVTLWINALRLALMYNAGDSTFDSSAINKCVYLFIYLQCAVMQTSYFIASHSGKLDRLLDELIVSSEFAEQVRKHAMACIVYNSLIATFSIAAGIRAIFMSNGEFDFVLAPFVTLIPVNDNWLIVLKILSFVVYSLVIHSWLWTLLMNVTITVILFLLFRQLNIRFRRAVGHRGQFKGNLKTFRSRHQALSVQHEQSA